MPGGTNYVICYIRLLFHSLLFSYMLFAENIAYDMFVTCACFVIVTCSGFGIICFVFVMLQIPLHSCFTGFL